MSDVKFNSYVVGVTKLSDFTPNNAEFAPLFQDTSAATVLVGSNSHSVPSPHTEYAPKSIVCSKGSITVGSKVIQYFNLTKTRTFKYEKFNNTENMLSYTDTLTFQLGVTHEVSAYDITENLKNFGYLTLSTVNYLITGVSASEQSVSVTATITTYTSYTTTYTVAACDKVIRVLDAGRSNVSGNASAISLTDNCTLTVKAKAITNIPARVSYNSVVYYVDSYTNNNTTITLKFHKARTNAYN